jgi:hypothetical protein
MVIALLVACCGQLEHQVDEPLLDGGPANSGGARLSAGTAGDGGAAGGVAVGGMSGGSTDASASGQTGSACDAACFASVAEQKSNFGMPWKSSWFLEGCKQVVGNECINIETCPNQGTTAFEDRGARTLETFPIGGTSGQHYKVTFTFNAAASAKVYDGGSRDAGTLVPPDVNNPATWVDAFYRDGAPVPNNYEVWKLSVFDENGAEARHYYMNSFPPPVLDGPPNVLPIYYEAHRLYSLSYTKSIVVIGGGKVTYLVQDSNCHTAVNCQMNLDPTCTIRWLPNEPNELVPPMYEDPADGMLKPTIELLGFNPTLMQPWKASLGHLTINKVEVTDDPVTQNYF